MSFHRPRVVVRWVIALLLVATSAGMSQGQTTYQWFGTANTWGAAGNWDSGSTTLTSANSDLVNTRLVFVGSAGGIGNNTNSNNLTHTDAGLFRVNQISFGGFGDAFTLNGNGVLLGASGITVAGSNEFNQLINLPITLGANQTWANNRTTTATFLTVAGNVTTGTNLLTLGGGGGIRLQTGTLTLGGGGVTVSNTGTVNLNGPIVQTAANTITKNGAGTFSVGGTINNGGFGLTLGGTGTSTYTGIISGAGGTTKTGAGVVNLNALNTYTGVTTITGGSLAANTLTDGGPNSLGNVAGVATDLVINGGFLRYTGTAVTTNRQFTLGVSGGGLEASGTGIITYSNAAALNFDVADAARTLTLGGTNIGANAFQGLIADNGTGLVGLTKTGAGNWVLSGSNTYTGVTTISGGTLTVDTLGNGGLTSSIGASTNAASNLVLNGGTLVYTGVTQITDRNFTLGTAGGTLNSSGTGALAFSNAAAIALNGTGARTLTLTGSNDGALAGILGDNGGATSLVKNGTGTWTLNGANTYTGTTTVNDGALILNVAGALNTATSLAVNGNGVLELGGFDLTVTGLNGNGRVRNTGANATLTINNAAASTFSGVLGSTTPAGDGFSLVKNGAGTLTLSGTNTYTGSTTINAGVLSVGLLANGGSDSGIGRSSNDAANLVLNGGTLRYTGAAVSTDRGFTLGINGGTIDSTTGALSLTNTGDITLLGNDIARTLTLTGTGGGVLNARLGDNNSAATSVVKAGTGTWVLNGLHLYSGTTTVTGGTLSISDNQNLGSGGPTNTLILNGGTLATTATTGLSTARGILVGPTTGSGTGTINVADTTTLTYGGVIANNTGGTGSLTKTGLGTLALSGNSTYGGATNLTAGTVRLGIADALPTTTTVAMSGTSTLELNGFGQSVAGLTGGATNLVQNTSGTAATLTVNNAVANTFAGILGNTAATGDNFGLTKAGAGTLTLTGNNTYAGVTTISGGVLQIGSGATTGSLGTGAVFNDASLIFNRSDVITVANNISGTGSVTQAGAGTTTLTGTNSYAGGTNISNGVLVIGNATALPTTTTATLIGTGILDLNGVNQTVAGLIGSTGTRVQNTSATDAILTVNNAVANAFDGTLGGSSNFSLVKTGAGTLTLTGTNTYTGTTTISGGVLQIGNGGATGTLGAGAVTNDASLAFNRNNSYTVANAISGTGSITKAGTGTVILTADNTYAGTTTISAGTLQVGNAGTTGSLGGGAVTNNASLVFNRNNSYTVANAISGTGSVTQAGTGITILTGANSYAGTTTISAGTLQVGNAGTTGSLGTGAVTNNSGLVFNRSDAITVANAISGTGTVIVGSTGTTVFTGNNSYGDTLIGGSATLQIGNAGTTGTLGGGAVLNNGSLVFNRTDAITVANVISSTGSVTQAGTGTTTLTGANSYAGTTAVNAGTLLVNGNQSAATGAVAVGNTATLGGTGSLGGAVTVSNGATLRAGSPANQVGSLTVGALELQDGSTLGVRITPAGNNRVIVTGTTIGIDSTSANAYQLRVDVTGTTFTHSQQVTYLIMEGVDQTVSLNLPTNRYTFVGFQGTPQWEAINVRLDTGLNSDPSNLYLSFTPVPEPGTVLAVGAGALGLGAFLRRRWKKPTPVEAAVAA